MSVTLTLTSNQGLSLPIINLVSFGVNILRSINWVLIGNLIALLSILLAVATWTMALAAW